MNVEANSITADYIRHLHQKVLLFLALLLMVLVVGAYAITHGAYHIALSNVLSVLFGLTKVRKLIELGAGIRAGNIMQHISPLARPFFSR